MLYIVAVLKLWSQKLALFLKMTEELRAFFLYRLSLLRFTTLEIKTEELKIFIYEHLKATICSWHCCINNVYPVKNCYFFQNENLEKSGMLDILAELFIFLTEVGDSWILICFHTQPVPIYCFGWSGWRKSDLTRSVVRNFYRNIWIAF